MQNSLKTNICNYINPLIGKKIIGYIYYDVTTEEILTTNNNGIDIIAHQIELSFNNGNTIFFSWTKIDNWSTYSLAVSNETFCKQVETFTTDSKYWRKIIDNTLNKFKIYGYSKNNEPHMILLVFNNGEKLGVANFFQEKDFIPKFAIGDDIWIIFGENNIENCINKLGLKTVTNIVIVQNVIRVNFQSLFFIRKIANIKSFI